MLVQEKQGAPMNRINNILPDHIVWIKSQLKSGKFMMTRGREVLIAVPGNHLKHIVNIPNKDEGNYIKSWVDVYNYGLDYLEGSLNAACLENKFIQRFGNNWTINGHIIIWPKFNPENANYARSLETILNEYQLIKDRYLMAIKTKEAGVSVKKSSVMLKPADQIVLPKNERVQTTDFPKVTYSSGASNFKLKSNLESSKDAVNLEIKQAVQDEIGPAEVRNLSIQKISDGTILDSRDINTLKNGNNDIVVLTCQDVNSAKEEDIFLRNASKCQYENFNVGAFIYGKANDEHMGAIELKRILKMLDQINDNFSRLVIYSIDNDYVEKNKNSDIKLLNFINVYNAIAGSLMQAGYSVMLSMNLKSGEIIGDINRRYNIQNEYEVIYMAIVRDINDVNKNSSVIVVDPGNDYDIVIIKNKEISNELNKNLNNRSLAKVA